MTTTTVPGLLAPRPSPGTLGAVHLGRIDLGECARVQERYAEDRRRGSAGNTVLFAEHPPSYCTGVLGKDRHMLLDRDQRDALGVQYYRLGRGGDVMYVGPGQVIAYPIIQLEDYRLNPVSYLRVLEQAVIRSLGDHAIRANRAPGLTGVWVRDAKIAGVAVKVSRGVTTFGFNINVCPDMEYFQHIVTCGNEGRPITSAEMLLVRAPTVSEVEQTVAVRLAEVLGEAGLAAPASRTREQGAAGSYEISATTAPISETS